MKIFVKILAFLAVILLVGVSAGVTVFHDYLSSTGEAYYSSTQMTDDSIQSVEFYNQGSADYSSTDTVASDEINSSMSGDFSGLTVFSEFTVVNNVGGESNLSISNESMSIDKSTTVTDTSFSASEDVSLASSGADSYRSELTWWFDAQMQKDRTTTVPALGLEQTNSTFNIGTGYYSSQFSTPLPAHISSDTYIVSD